MAGKAESNRRDLKILHTPFLYVIIDGRERILEKLKGIIKAGVGIVQLRDKNLSARELVSLGRRIEKITRNKCLFFINDRFDISLAAGAHGVHLGQDDLPVEAVRKIAGKKFFIGLSTHTINEIEDSHSRPIDYLSFGPVFKTKTKSDARPPRGIGMLKKAVPAARYPVVAVGGINIDNLKQVLDTAVSGVAISSGILDKGDTYKATLAIKKVLCHPI